MATGYSQLAGKVENGYFDFIPSDPFSDSEQVFGSKYVVKAANTALTFENLLANHAYNFELYCVNHKGTASELNQINNIKTADNGGENTKITLTFDKEVT